MKKVILGLSIVMTVFMLMSSCGSVAKNESSTSNEVTIGNQVWMKKNLNVDKFRNGDIIPEAKTAEEWKKADENKQPAWCFYNNDPTNGEKFGKLYNWHAVNDPRGLAPEGYHIPSEAELNTLIDYSKSKSEGAAGKFLKSSYGWSWNEGNGTDESGFSGLPGGKRDEKGVFKSIYDESRWFSSSEWDNDEMVWVLELDLHPWAERPYNKKGAGLSVRCLKN